jgi:hypothetical protein
MNMMLLLSSTMNKINLLTGFNISCRINVEYFNVEVHFDSYFKRLYSNCTSLNGKVELCNIYIHVYYIHIAQLFR